MMILVAVHASLSISRTLAVSMTGTALLLGRQDEAFWLPLVLNYINATAWLQAFFSHRLKLLFWHFIYSTNLNSQCLNPGLFLSPLFFIFTCWLRTPNTILSGIIVSVTSAEANSHGVASVRRSVSQERIPSDEGLTLLARAMQLELPLASWTLCEQSSILQKTSPIFSRLLLYSKRQNSSCYRRQVVVANSMATKARFFC